MSQVRPVTYVFGPDRDARNSQPGTRTRVATAHGFRHISQDFLSLRATDLAGKAVVPDRGRRHAFPGDGRAISK